MQKFSFLSRICKKVVEAPPVFVFLSFIYPSVYLIRINSHIYTVKQIIVTFLFIFLFSLIAMVIVGVLANLLSRILVFVKKYFRKKGKSSNLVPKLYGACIGATGTIILLILLHSANRELIPAIHNVLWLPIYILAALVVGGITYRLKLTLFNMILCLLILTNGVLWVVHRFEPDSIYLDTRLFEQSVLFKNKPNVYLVILESYASLDMREQIYGIDNEYIKNELIKRNYAIYKTYSNYPSSLESVTSIFMMRHHYFKPSRGIADGAYRNIIGGENNNPVINIFLNNGYWVDYRKFDPYFYQLSSAVHSKQVRPLLEPIAVFDRLIAFLNVILNNLEINTEIFKKLLWCPEKILGLPIETVDRMVATNSGKPVFTVLYGGATHTPISILQYPDVIRQLPGASKMPFWKLNQINNYWITTYKNLVTKSDAALIELIHGIHEKTPDAVVVLIGDHGPNFNKGRFEGTDDNLNDNIIANGINPSELTRDYFEVFMAVKWPKENKMTHGYFSHVNLFRHIFASLANNPSILDSRVSDDSYLMVRKNFRLGKMRHYVTVKDGKLLDRWEPFTIPVAQ